MKSDMTGKRFGRLVAIEESGRLPVTKAIDGLAWLFRCDCGSEVRLLGQRVRAGATRSCGCLRKATARARGRSQPHVIEPGYRHGDLTVIESVEDDQPGRRYLAACGACGDQVVRSTAALRTGPQDCGCGKERRIKEAAEMRAAERRQERLAEIGVERLADHPLYTTWSGMISRCSLPSHRYYRIYGARGIRVCSQWSGPGGFEQFVKDMGERPADPHDWDSKRPFWTLDRVNVDGHYEPSNVRWATPKQQCATRRPRRRQEATR